ncbi:MAG: creD [Paucimonas sp.]|jgi:inner membrane protein|nr:creD [Paucimonas sp.]
MQKPLLIKIVIIAVLMALIGIPLSMIQSTISERNAYRDQAVHSIAQDSVHEQGVIGPVLVVPYTDAYEEEQVLDVEKQTKKIVKRTIRKKILAFPNGLQIKGDVDTDHRYRGIHKVLVYRGQFAVAGDFLLPSLDNLPRDKTDSRITVGQPFVALTIDDVRGIRNIPVMQWNERKIEFEQGAGLDSIQAGLHAPVALDNWKAGLSVKFSFNIGLDGIQRLQFSPVAKNNVVTLKSSWPHPQFGGRFMPSPKDRKIDENGFAATWDISALATNAQQQLMTNERAANAPATAVAANHAPVSNLDHFSVGFIEPVNIYSQADRAVKYGLLFIALTFAAFFLFEMLKQLPIHPVQYLLVGLALALFFLLLVSLSEHIRFELAYLIASGACILLIGFYLSYVLRDWKRGFGFGTGLTILYGVLFGLLRSEDNALMMGSILLFSVLAAVMITTRKVDWYKVASPARADTE